MQGLTRLETLLWLPLKAAAHEFYQVRIIDLECVCKRASGGLTDAATRILHKDGLVVVIKEDSATRCFGYQRAWRHANDLHDSSHLVVLVFAGEDGHTYEALKDNAAERPHVDSRCVCYTKHNLGCTIESRLNVRIETLCLEAARAVVDQLDLALVELHEQHVLGFEIAVHDRELVHVVEGL